MGIRRALWVLPIAALTGCLVSIGDVEHDPASGGAAGSGGTSPDASAGTSGAGGSTNGGAAGSGGSSGSAGAGGSNGGSAGASGTAGSSGSAGAAPCLAGIQDDFEGPTFDAQWFPYASPAAVTLSQAQGTLVVELPSSDSPSYGGISTNATIDVTGCSVLIRVLKTPNPLTKAYAHFALQGEGNNVVELFATAGQLEVQRWQNDVPSTVHSEALDLGKQAWWRLREAGGTIYAETSGDGQTWNSFASTAAPFEPSKVDVAIGAGTYQGESEPGGAAFDNLNLPP